MPSTGRGPSAESRGHRNAQILPPATRTSFQSFHSLSSVLFYLSLLLVLFIVISLLESCRYDLRLTTVDLFWIASVRTFSKPCWPAMDMGVGHAGIDKLCRYLDMKSMHHTTSLYCHRCTHALRRYGGKQTAALQQSFAAHRDAAECNINYEGASGSMEKAAAVT